MKIEKNENGEDVMVFEKKPWEEEKPCWDCKKRKEPPEEDPESGYHGRISIALGRMAFWFANRAMRRFHRKAKRCDGCKDLKKWTENREYWENRKMEVAASTPATSSKNILYAGLVEKTKRRAEDDEGSEREINGEADEERDKEADAED